MKLTPAEMMQICLDVVSEMQTHPYLINEGDCDRFASRLIERMGGQVADGVGPVLRWGHQDSAYFTPAHCPEHHCYVLYDGLYYDAEQPYGVPRPDMLPYYMRQLLHHEESRAAASEAVSRRYA